MKLVINQQILSCGQKSIYFYLITDVLLGSISKLKFTNETVLGMEAVQLIMEDQTFLQLQEAGLEIMNNPERLMQCVMQDFHIQCRDDRKVSF